MSRTLVKKRSLSLPVRNLGGEAGRYGTLAVLLGVFFLFAVTAPSFFSFGNLSNVLSQSSVLAIVAVGLCFVVASGGIDLSVAVSFDIGAMTAVLLLKSGAGWLPSMLIGLAAGALVGLLNSLLVVKAKIAPFLATLGTLFIGESMEKIVTKGGEPVYFPGMSEAFKWLGRGSLFVWESGDGTRIDFKFSIVIAAAVAAAAYFLLSRTVLGRYLHAIGAQKEAAALSGVPVKRYTAYAFVLCGLICSLAGMIGSSVLTSYVPMSGRYYLMDAIGAVFIGSMLHRKGYVNVPGTLVGVLFFGILANGLNLSGIHFYWQSVVRGGVIFAILALNSAIANRRLHAAKSNPVA